MSEELMLEKVIKWELNGGASLKRISVGNYIEVVYNGRKGASVLLARFRRDFIMAEIMKSEGKVD